MQVVWLSKLMWRGAMINFVSEDCPYPWTLSRGTRIKLDDQSRKLRDYLCIR